MIPSRVSALFFTGSLPGISHDTLKDLNNVLKTYTTWIDHMNIAVTILASVSLETRAQHTQSRLRNECFSAINNPDKWVTPLLMSILMTLMLLAELCWKTWLCCAATRYDWMNDRMWRRALLEKSHTYINKCFLKSYTQYCTQYLHIHESNPWQHASDQSI